MELLRLSEIGFEGGGAADSFGAGGNAEQEEYGAGGNAEREEYGAGGMAAGHRDVAALGGDIIEP